MLRQRVQVIDARPHRQGHGLLPPAQENTRAGHPRDGGITRPEVVDEGLERGYGLVLSMATLLLEDFGARRNERLSDRLIMLPWVVVESLGYRQLTVLWRLRGLASYLRGSKEWGAMTRKGFVTGES